MAKRKITVTVDEEVLEVLRSLDAPSVSSVVNDAIVEHVERIARHQALGDLLARWERERGRPVKPELLDWAAALRAEVEGTEAGRGAA